MIGNFWCNIVSVRCMEQVLLVCYVLMLVKFIANEFGTVLYCISESVSLNIAQFNWELVGKSKLEIKLMKLYEPCFEYLH